MKNQYNTALTSERIKSRAKEIGMTISQLNLICELSENTIKNAGKSAEGMKAKNLFTIAEALDCSVDYLLGRSDSPRLHQLNIFQKSLNRLKIIEAQGFLLFLFYTFL